MSKPESDNARPARTSRWFPAVLIVWNILDIVVHVALNLSEPWRVAGNVVAVVATLIVVFGIARRYHALVLAVAAVIVVVVNVIHSVLNGWLAPSFVFIGVTVLMLLLWAQRLRRASSTATDGERTPFALRWWAALMATVVGLGVIAVAGEQKDFVIGPLAALHNGELVAADYWSDEPTILSAGLGFDNIVGVPELTEQYVREAGGSWYASVTCTNGEAPSDSTRTSTSTTEAVSNFYKGRSEFDDGLPIVFSWPVATETVDLTDFQFTLNTGEVVFPNSIGMWPNWELNERNTVVAFGDFGNRGLSSESDVVFPIRLDIVEDDTPLLLVGPGGQEVDAVGLSWETDQTPYDAGPSLVGAKLNHVGEEVLGEGGFRIGEQVVSFPNDERALYDEADFRLRVLTTGGFSPDGVTGVRPNMFEDFFRVHVTGVGGETVVLDEVGVDYAVEGGTLRVVGLSDLGRKGDPENGVYYDDCYSEDRDNYIDIILVGDDDAARSITFVEIPALEGGYGAFYNPGGPGPEPFDGVRYTAPGPPDLEPVINALDDPMRVDRAAH